jgi:signal transduction histidine kinase
MEHVIDRARLAWQRVGAAPEAPLAAAAVLGVLAMAEVVDGIRPDTNVFTELLLALCATVPVALLSAQVLVAAGAVTLANVLALAGGIWPASAGVVAQLLAGYRLARGHAWWLSVLLGPLPFAVYAVVRPGFVAFLLLGLVTGAAALGVVVRQYHEALVRKGIRAAMADSRLEHVARGERARIARELHDVVAHHISLIAVQAETARLTTPGLPPEGERRFAAIGDTARLALTEMRRLLGVLREDAGTEPSRAPQPGLEQLNDLIDEARESAGASTRLIVRGAVRPLDRGIELTAYRIVQEALTNARRHAPGAPVDVELSYCPEALRLRVRDSGPGPGRLGEQAGHGLVGMRERVAAVGGTLSAGAGRLGGFLVEVELPTGTVS